MYIIEQITEINPFGRRIRCADPNVKPDAKSRNNNIGGNGKIYIFFFFYRHFVVRKFGDLPRYKYNCKIV